MGSDLRINNGEKSEPNFIIFFLTYKKETNNVFFCGLFLRVTKFKMISFYIILVNTFFIVIFSL